MEVVRWKRSKSMAWRRRVRNRAVVGGEHPHRQFDSGEGWSLNLLDIWSLELVIL